MATEKTIVVSNVTVETRERKDGKGTFETLNIISDDGQEFNGYVDKNTPELSKGDSLKVLYQNVSRKDGTTFNKILKLEQYKESATSSSSSSILKNTKSNIVSSSLNSSPTSKDVSMEVSGLLQAIITKHGLSDSTEEQLRSALRLKRTVAQELEKNGSV